MSKITDAAGNALEFSKALPEIDYIKPVGNQILVEVLTPKELMGPTAIHVPSGSETVVQGAPQGYILSIGPKVDPTFGFEVGNRIVLSGSFTPLPEQAAKNGRPQGCVEPHMIKAVLVEKADKTEKAKKFVN